LGIDSPSLGQPEPGLLAEPEADLPRDILDDFALQDQETADVAFVALDPERPVFGRMDQPGRDAHLFSRPQDRAFNDHVGVQLFGDLRQGFLCFLVLDDGRQRPHSQGVDLPQFRDEGIRHPLGKIILFRIMGEVFQGEDRQ
jgi:hypothetical protein